MNEDIKIVPIAEEYIESFNAALGVVARERKYIALSDAPPMERTKNFVNDSVKNDWAHFVAVSGDKVVGWCDVIPSSKGNEKHIGELGMGMLPEFRGKGLGTKLVSITLEKAKKQGLVRVEIWVYADNIAAVNLYKKMGFKIEGTCEKSSKIGDEYKNDHVMALLFEENI